MSSRSLEASACATTCRPASCPCVPATGLVTGLALAMVTERALLAVDMGEHYFVAFTPEFDCEGTKGRTEAVSAIPHRRHVRCCCCLTVSRHRVSALTPTLSSTLTCAPSHPYTSDPNPKCCAVSHPNPRPEARP